MLLDRIGSGSEGGAEAAEVAGRGDEAVSCMLEIDVRGRSSVDAGSIDLRASTELGEMDLRVIDTSIIDGLPEKITDTTRAVTS